MRGGSRVVGSARRGAFLPIINNLLTAIGRLDRAAERWGRKEGDRLSISRIAVDRLLSRVYALCSQNSERREKTRR